MQILKARALLTHELKNRSYSVTTTDSKSEAVKASAIETVKHPIHSDEVQTVDISAMETVKHPIHCDEIQIVDKSVIKEGPLEGNDEDDADDADDADEWLKEESSDIAINRVRIPIKDVEDVSFSDFEDDDDDDGNIPIHYKKAT